MKKQMLLAMDELAEVDGMSPGKDEMNFAEHPITLLTDRVPKGQTSVIFEDEVYCDKRKKVIPRKRIIEGSENYGLPTATDDTVVLALIQLTKQRNNFTQPEVEFTRLELIKLLGWADEGASYERIKKSLLRIKLVNYIYDNAWWDSKLKMWTTKAFSILNDVEINDSRTGHIQSGLFPSRIVWNAVIFDSFQAGFLRNIDFQLCMRLKHPIALRMYRFLGKRFYVRPDCVFDLKEFATSHLALGGKYEGGTQIARKLKPAIAELEAVGFLEPLSEKERFVKKGREWSIRFIQKMEAPPALPDSEQKAKSEPSDLTAELIKRGVSAKTAAKLVKQHSAEAITLQIDILDWMEGARDKRVAKSPAGFLVKSITDAFAPPKGFIPQAERERQAEAKRQKDEDAAAQRRHQREQEAAEKAERQRITAYRKKLTPEQLVQLEADAIAQADAAIRQTLEQTREQPFRRMLLGSIVDEHIRHLLREQSEPA